MSGRGWRSGLLVSVRDAAEAAVAAANGASIIDVKEPARGPLGRADAAVVGEIVAAVAGRAPVTLACGELAEGLDSILGHVGRVVESLPPAAVPVAVKAGPAGLAEVAWREAFAALARGLPAGIEAVAVAYADWLPAAAPRPEAIIGACGSRATVLVDTFDKRGPGLFAVAGGRVVADWVARAVRGDLALALAGRLDARGVAAGFSLGADVCGVRSAACDGGRHGRLAARRVRRLATLSTLRPARIAAAPSRSGNHVKSLEVRVPHQLDPTEVRRRLERGIERARQDYADNVSEIEATWEADGRLQLTLVVMGMSIASEVEVLQEELAVRLDLPGMAGLFAGRIRSGIAERLGGLLEAPA